MIERNIEAMTKAIRDWEYRAGESFPDYFMDNWAFGSWAYFLLGRGYTEWANDIINRNEQKEILGQEDKFEWFGTENNTGDWSEKEYLKNVRVWADYLVSSDQYYRRVNKFFDEYFQEDGGNV